MVSKKSWELARFLLLRYLAWSPSFLPPPATAVLSSESVSSPDAFLDDLTDFV